MSLYRVAVVVVAVGAVTVHPSVTPGLLSGASPDAAGMTTVHGRRQVGVGRWTVRVRLGRRKVGPLRLSTGHLRRAPQTTSKPWVQHTVRIRNVARRKVRLGDTRISAYLHGPVRRGLLGADEGCGYGITSGSDEIDVGVCADYLDAPRLRPGERIKRTVTLFKGLKGMQPLRAGTYVFNKKIRYKVRGRERRTRRVRLFYEIERR